MHQGSFLVGSLFHNNYGKVVKMILKAIMKHVDMWVDIEIIQLQGASSTRPETQLSARTTNYIRGALPSHNHMCLHRWNMENIRKNRFCVTDRNNILTHDTCFGTWNHVNGPTCLKRKVSQLVHTIPWSIPNVGVIPSGPQHHLAFPRPIADAGRPHLGPFSLRDTDDQPWDFGVPMGTRFSTNPCHPVSVFLLEWNGQLSSLIWPCLSNFLVSMMLCHPQGNSSRPFYLDLSTRSNSQVQSPYMILYTCRRFWTMDDLYFLLDIWYIYIYT